jgi:hypothetical protein
METKQKGLNMAEIDWNAPTVAPVEGEYGKDRRGETFGPLEFVGHHAGGEYFKVPCGKAWMCNGSWTDIPHACDLIAIIPAPDSVEPDATQKAGAVVLSVVTRCRVTRFATESMPRATYHVIMRDDGDFTIKDDDHKVLDASPAAAVAIARAILRMAGENK